MTAIGPVMLDLEGKKLTSQDQQLLANPLVGGVILFSRNFENAHQLLELTTSIKSINPNLIIAVDQEGGRVQRFKSGFSQLPALANFGYLAESDLESAKTYARFSGELMAREIISVGCDISFAPVLDLGNSCSAVIGDRAFSTDPECLVQLAAAYIDGMNSAGMAATGKHFPGHGSVCEDSHYAIGRDERSLKTIKNNDLIPFVKLISNLGAMMPAHLIYPLVDSQAAGFSSVWLKTILREELAFKGVIFSDDLSMKGAEVAGGYVERAAAALDAGCDMILVCNNREGALSVLDSLGCWQASSESSARLSKLLSSQQASGIDALKQTQRWQFLAASAEKFSGDRDVTN